MTAVGAVFLASHLAYWLTGGADFVDHSVLGLVTPDLSPEKRYFFLRYPDRLVTLGTQISTHEIPAPQS